MTPPAPAAASSPSTWPGNSLRNCPAVAIWCLVAATTKRDLPTLPTPAVPGALPRAHIAGSPNRWFGAFLVMNLRMRQVRDHRKVGPPHANLPLPVVRGRSPNSNQRSDARAAPVRPGRDAFPAEPDGVGTAARNVPRGSTPGDDEVEASGTWASVERMMLVDRVRRGRRPAASPRQADRGGDAGAGQGEAGQEGKPRRRRTVAGGGHRDRPPRV